MDKKIQTYEAIFPGRVYAGQGSLRRVTEIMQEKQSRSAVALVDRAVVKLEVVLKVLALLGQELSGVIDDIPQEPSDMDIGNVYERLTEWNADLVIAIGGGSVMDMAKVVAAAATNPKFAAAGFMDAGLIENPPLPTIMAPTTSGTGAESTPNAIFLIPQKELKVGVISPSFLASYVILEPELTIGLPPALTASTGLDAFCHAVESFLSRKANPISRTFSIEAAKLIAQNLETAYLDGTNTEARENMQLGSFLAGLCLSSSTTVAVHALSYPLGGKYHIPHGISNAILLPSVLEINLPDCQKEYEELAKALCLEEVRGKDMARVFVDWVYALCSRLKIPDRLTDYGVRRADLDVLTEKAMEVDRLLSQNPRKLTREEIRGIYERLL